MATKAKFSKATVKAAESLKGVSDPTRLSVLDMLISTKKPEIAVADMIKKLQIEPTLLSHHLSILKGNGLIKSERKGKSVSYRINPTAMNGKGLFVGKFKLVWPEK